MKLVILESPNKRKTVSHYLGAGFMVEASGGHFRDLPEDDLGVDLSTFTPTYVVDKEKRGLVKRLKELAHQADQVILATDADREGEAISWHLAEVLGLRRPMRLKTTEITASGLKQAMANLVPLDQNLVDAQQARRVVDRIYGYGVSEAMQKASVGRSAGRVQTPTLHLVVAREIERENFKAEPYWIVSTYYDNGLVARCATKDQHGKVVPTRLKREQEAKAAEAAAKGNPHTVSSVTTEPMERRPRPPFTTSTLQQAASAKLDLKPEKTMSIAQGLFERGHITYHRTDSVALSEDALAMARAFIQKDYPAALPDKPNRFKAKANAQGSHEAIRPTALEPAFPADLTADEKDLYDLIRRRFISCQCKPATLDQTIVIVTAGPSLWRASGAVVAFDGFLHYASDDEEKDTDPEDEEQGALPKVANGQKVVLTKVDVAAKTTKPSRRFTRATLIREMERTGIGRPSTYANTVRVLFDREYVAEKKKEVYPTALGRLVDVAMAAGMPELLETKTTADLEAVLDEIADGKQAWKGSVASWHGPFATKLAAAPEAFAAAVAANKHLATQTPHGPTAEPTGVTCPRCKANELIKRSRSDNSGYFLSCSGWKKDGSGCSFSSHEDAKAFDQPCPKCGGLMWIATDRYGTRAAVCVAKDCGGRVNPETSGQCPACGTGQLVLRKSEEGGGGYFVCTNWRPKGESCTFSIGGDAKPYGQNCPKCGSAIWGYTAKDGRKTARCVKPSCKTYLEIVNESTQACLVCGRPMHDRGAYLRCSGFKGKDIPGSCPGTLDKAALAAAFKSKRTCPKCGSPMLKKAFPGKDPFLGCGAYPRCKHIEKVAQKPARTKKATA